MSDFKTPLELLQTELNFLRNIEEKTGFVERRTKANELIPEYTALIKQLKQANDINSENANCAIFDVSQQREQLVNFLWEQYKINRLITKKVYMQMVTNARKLTN